MKLAKGDNRSKGLEGSVASFSDIRPYRCRPEQLWTLRKQVWLCSSTVLPIDPGVNSCCGNKVFFRFGGLGSIIVLAYEQDEFILIGHTLMG